jgi:hypothetical protein
MKRTSIHSGRSNLTLSLRHPYFEATVLSSDANQAIRAVLQHNRRNFSIEKAFENHVMAVYLGDLDILSNFPPSDLPLYQSASDPSPENVQTLCSIDALGQP